MSREQLHSQQHIVEHLMESAKIWEPLQAKVSPDKFKEHQKKIIECAIDSDPTDKFGETHNKVLMEMHEKFFQEQGLEEEWKKVRTQLERLGNEFAKKILHNNEHEGLENFVERKMFERLQNEYSKKAFVEKVKNQELLEQMSGEDGSTLWFVVLKYMENYLDGKTTWLREIAQEKQKELENKFDYKYFSLHSKFKQLHKEVSLNFIYQLEGDELKTVIKKMEEVQFSPIFLLSYPTDRRTITISLEDFNEIVENAKK